MRRACPAARASQNRPHFTTLKALQIANATPVRVQRDASTDNRREHQGWGMPGRAIDVGQPERCT